jgi:hypothetical protein
MGRFGIVIPLLALGAASGMSFPDQTAEEQVSVNGKKYFSLEQVPVYSDNPRSIVSERARMYRKYGWKLPKELKTAMETETNQGTGHNFFPIPMESVVFKVQVGGHNMSLVLSTSSGDL